MIVSDQGVITDGVPTTCKNNLCKKMADSKGYTIEMMNWLDSLMINVLSHQSKRERLREILRFKCFWYVHCTCSWVVHLIN